MPILLNRTEFATFLAFFIAFLFSFKMKYLQVYGMIFSKITCIPISDSGGAAKEHHCVENWPSKGVEVRTCSKFTNNLIPKLSVLLHRENWVVQSNSSSTSCQTVVVIKFSHSIRAPRENLGDARLFTYFMLINWPVFY